MTHMGQGSTIRPLSRRVRFSRGETPTGYLGRLASRNGVDLACFASEMGISPNLLGRGHEPSLVRLAGLAAMPADRLRDDAFRIVDGRWWWAGERILRPMLRRAQLHVCPRCLLDDVANGGGRAVSAWQRASWCLTPVLTCPDHGTELVVVCRGSAHLHMHDFALRLTPVLGRLEELAAEAPRRGPSGLQDYLLARKEGSRDLPWLDAMPFYVAAEVTSLLGRVALWGRNARSRDVRTLGDRHAADDAGFVLMRQGEVGVVSLLEHLLSTFERFSSRNNHHSIFFAIFRALDKVENKDDYSAVRKVVGRYIVEHLPLPPGEYLGVVLERRRHHTVHSAAAQVGANAEHLRSVLAGQGVIGPDQVSKQCNEIVLDQSHDGLIEDLSSRLTIRGAAARLRLSRNKFQSWVDAGIVRPFTRTPERRRRTELYREADLDALMRRLVERAEACDRAPDGFVTLTDAARRSRRPSAAIVTNLLAGRELGLRHLRDVEGVDSLLLDPAEVKRGVEAPIRDGSTMAELCRRWHVSWKAACRLRDEGVLAPVTPRERTGHPAPRYDGSSLEAFMGSHVTLGRLASEVRRSAVDLRDELEGAGIGPVFEPAPGGGTFYRRADVEYLFPIGPTPGGTRVVHGLNKGRRKRGVTPGRPVATSAAGELGMAVHGPKP